MSEVPDWVKEFPRLLTVSEVAKQLGVSKMTIYRELESRRIAHYRFVDEIYRIPEPAVMRYLEEHF